MNCSTSHRAEIAKKLVSAQKVRLPPVPERAPKSVQNCTFCTLFAQESLFLTLFCADSFFGDFGSVARIAIHNFMQENFGLILRSLSMRRRVMYTPATLYQETRRGPVFFMGHKVAWKTGMLICHPAFDSLHSEVSSPLNFATHEIQARRNSTKINFLGPETARWGGGLPRKGVVVENFVPSLESLSSLGFEERNLGCPGSFFAGMSRTPGGVQKVCEKKKFMRIFVA